MSIMHTLHCSHPHAHHHMFWHAYFHPLGQQSVTFATLGRTGLDPTSLSPGRGCVPIMNRLLQLTWKAIQGKKTHHIQVNTLPPLIHIFFKKELYSSAWWRHQISSKRFHIKSCYCKCTILFVEYWKLQHLHLSNCKSLIHPSRTIYISYFPFL